MAKSKNKSQTSNFSYPNGVLKNRYSIKSPEAFNAMYSYYVKKEIGDLYKAPMPERFDSEYLRHIHRQLFKNVFDWAGYTRDTAVKLSDGTLAVMTSIDDRGSGVPFAEGNQEIQRRLTKLDVTISQKNNLKGLSRGEFIYEATKLFSDLYKIHPFVAGNGRTSQIFFERLAQNAGHQLDFSLITADRLDTACRVAAKYNDLVPMKEMFEDISDPKKVQILKEFMDKAKQRGEDVQSSLVLTAKEGRDYQGTYQNVSENTFAIAKNGIYVVCSKECLTPEQRKSLRSGDEFSFTVPNGKALSEVLIPAEKVSPLTDKEIAEKVSRDIIVKAAQRKVQRFSELVYGKPGIFDSRMNLINEIPDSGDRIPNQVEDNPRSFHNLAGYKLFGYKTDRRLECEENIGKLSDALRDYATAVKRARVEIVDFHQADQARRGIQVEMPGKIVQSLFSVSSKTRHETLMESPSLQKELLNFIQKVNSRLSPSERQAVSYGDDKKLANSIGVSKERAETIGKTIRQIKHEYEKCTLQQRECVRVHRPRTMSVAS
ncbi:BID domain-containing T4SS effector [Bartonella sp. CB178]|uniref:BID domain-containing T4SS effector n=1 Tax=Bartonella sp. CB178 TaxID=3112255 RepID=UPI00300DD5BA